MSVGLVIEEIIEEGQDVPPLSSLEQTVVQKKSSDTSKSSSTANNGNPKSNADSLDALRKDPEAVR